MERGGGRGRSFNFISRMSIRKSGFQLMTITPGQQSPRFRDVSFQALLDTQHQQLEQALRRLLDSLRKEEMEHRERFRADKFVELFPGVLHYFDPSNRRNADTLDSESHNRVETSSSILEPVIRCALGRRERLAARDAPVATAFPGPGSVETVAHDVPGTHSSMDRTYGIGTSAILHFGLALVDERTVSLEIGLKL